LEEEVPVTEQKLLLKNIAASTGATLTSSTLISQIVRLQETFASQSRKKTTTVGLQQVTKD
jgi:hypothetical protein